MVCQALLFACLALFFNSFQTFMRGETVPGGAAHRGTLHHGLERRQCRRFSEFRQSVPVGQPGPLAMTLLVGMVILLTLVRHQPRPHAMASADEHMDEAGPAHGR